MHIHNFADCCSFSETAIGGTLPSTDKTREMLKKLHPKQILNSRISFPLYCVKYSYETIRGNYREGEKYYFAQCGEHPEFEFEVEMKLEDWVAKENIERPYRAMSNVQILGIDRVAYAEICL